MVEATTDSLSLCRAEIFRCVDRPCHSRAEEYVGDASFELYLYECSVKGHCGDSRRIPKPSPLSGGSRMDREATSKMGQEIDPLMLRSELPLMAVESSIIFDGKSGRYSYLLVACLAS